MKTNTEKRILLIDPSSIVREGLRAIFNDSNGYSVVACYSDASQLEEKCVKHRPNIIIINPQVISLNLKATIRNQYSIQHSIQLVAFVYGIVDDLLLQQFDTVLSIFDDYTRIINKLQSIQRERATEQRHDTKDLSERENEILVSISKGMTNKEIAEKHFISIHTVISHRKNIIRKTGIKTVSGLTVYALLNNLIGYQDIE